jgi:mRNA export factor
MYNYITNKLLSDIPFVLPQLDCCFENLESIYCVGLDKELKRIDFTQNKVDIISSEVLLSKVKYVKELSLLITCGLDSIVSLFDTKSHSVIETIDLESKVYSVDYSNNTLGIVGTNLIHFIDMRNMKAPLQTITQNVKMQPTCLRFYNSGYFISGYEGKISYEDFTDSSKCFSFKCHRDEQEVIYPINSIEIHPQ